MSGEVALSRQGLSGSSGSAGLLSTPIS